jgi:hypothetical protein
MKENFKKNNFVIIKQCISKELSNFIYQYFLLKRKVFMTFINTNYISRFNDTFGTLGDIQIDGTYCHYADIVMETLLSTVKPIMENNTGLELLETYSYARIYKKGDVLEKHKDRFSCEISTTLNLGGDSWPIFIESKNKNGLQIDLNPGDMLIYKGNILEHWRNEFKGDNCGQVFLHYNNKNSKDSHQNVFDGRPHLGLPPAFKKK